MTSESLGAAGGQGHSEIQVERLKRRATRPEESRLLAELVTVVAAQRQVTRQGQASMVTVSRTATLSSGH